MQSNDIAGNWTYRSFRNDPTPTDGDPDKLAALLFAEAEFRLQVDDSGNITGVIDWGSGGLDLKGTIRVTAGGGPLTVDMIGTGRPGSQTDGWQYDYYAYGAHEWPNGVNQVPALVGSVLRAKPHGSAPAGYSASFIAVKKS